MPLRRKNQPIPGHGGNLLEGPEATTPFHSALTVLMAAKSNDNSVAGATADLARRLGVELEYVNAAGKRIVCAPKVIRAVLAAMGYRVENEKSARNYLKALDDTEHSRRLPPVLVITQDQQPAQIAVKLPKDGPRLTWRVVLEDGSIVEEGAINEHEHKRVRKTSSTAVSTIKLSKELPCGYHRFELDNDRMPLIIAPPRCWQVPIEHGEKIWGIAAQLYQLRSGRNWGVGDFTDLRDLVEIAAAWGASIVGLNPLHALFLDEPERASPYAPASRLFLNVLNIDISAIPEFETCEQAPSLVASEAFKSALEAARSADLVDYGTVAELKLQALRLIYSHFKTGAAIARQRSFETFVHIAGEALNRFCTFQAIRLEMAAGDSGPRDWRLWPDELQDPGSPGTAQFAADHREEIEFLKWTQWVADTQLRDAAYHAESCGMTVGLYRDLAVGCSASSAESWSDHDVVVAAAHAGAPPDIINPAGQDWGLPPFNPRTLRESGYAAFIDLVRANMRYSGGLRIDHVVGLHHLYWIPRGSAPAEGAYVQYPFDDLTGILMLESWRNQCLVIGEDLGTVPAGFRDRMAERGILSYRVMYFEQDPDSGEFIAPERYPALALATVGSHDLATLRGWWLANDVDIRERHHLYPDSDEGRRQRDTRQKEKAGLLAALRRQELDPGSGEDFVRLSKSVHAFVARSSAAIAMVQLENLTGEVSQVNLPATTKEHPNWRRRLSMTLEEIKNSADVAAVIAAVRRERPPRPA